MKNLPLFVALVATFCFGSVRLCASGIDPIVVPVHINAVATLGSGPTIDPWFSMTLQEGSSGSAVTLSSLSDFGGKTVVAMVPNQIYYLNIDAPNCATASFSVVAPPGYTATIDGQLIPTENDFAGDGGGFYVLQITPNDQSGAANAGVASSFLSDHPYWQVSVGHLRDGSSAGWISIDADYTSSNLSALFTSAALNYEAPSTEVTVVHSNTSDPTSSIRQIIGNEALVDVEPGPSPYSSTSYYLNFYSMSGLSTSSGTPISIPSGTMPFVSYLVSKGSSTSQITVTSMTFDSTYTSWSSPARTAVTTLTASGSSFPYTFTTQDWHTSGGSPYVQIVVSNAGSTDSSAPEATSVSYSSGSSVLNVSKLFASETWSSVYGLSLISKTTGTGSYPIVESDQYYLGLGSSSANLGFPMVSSVNGSWVGYEYQSNSNADANDGIVSKVHKQYLQSSTVAPTSLSGDTNGAVTSYSYTQNAFGVYALPTSIQTVYSGATIANAGISYEGYTGTQVKLNNVISVVANRTDSTGSSTVASQVCSFREDISDVFYQSKPWQITRSDGTADLFVYQRGAYSSTSSGTAFPASSGSCFSTSGLGSTTATNTRIVVIHGCTSSSGNTAITSTADGYSFVPTTTTDVAAVYLVANQSTAEVTVRDQYAHVVYTESDVWDGSAWHMFSPVKYGYDSNNHHLTSVNAGGLTTTYTYVGEQLTSQTDPAGVVTNYTYDVSGRQAIVQVQATSSSLSSNSLTTTSTYDAAGHVVAKVVGSSITTSASYDDAGRVASETDPNTGTTYYSYAYSSLTSSPLTNTNTVTMPNGGTKIDVTTPDGYITSETGTGVIPRSWSYTQNSGGTLTTAMTINPTSSGTQRTETVTTDLLGRTTSSVKPSYTGGSYTVTNSYNSAGQLSEVQRTGGSSALPNILYLYDAMGHRYREGLDIDGSTGLQANSTLDRITDTIEGIQVDSTGVWSTTTTTTYPSSGSGTGVNTSIVRDRLMTSNLSSTLEAEEKVTDSYGTTTDTQTSVSSSTNSVVTETTNPGFSSTAETISVAGLPTSSTGFDGLSTTIGYDNLWRPISKLDSRSNTSLIYYNSGTTQVSYTKDGSGAITATYTYDGAGRVIQVADNLTNTTQTAYNLLNQVVFQGGTGRYPVSYSYDGWGQRQTMTTYTGGATWSNSLSAPSISGSGTSATTTWGYDQGTGLLTSKEDASSHTVSFTYDAYGRTLTRVWARSVTTTYAYSSTTGDLTGVGYSDGTTSIGYTYNRAGQISTVTDATGTRTFAYDSTVDSNPLELESEHLDSSFYGGRWLSRLYQNGSAVGGTGWGGYTPGFVLGRPIGFQLGSSENTQTDLRENYTYSALGQFVGVTTNTQNTSSPSDFIYTYASGSNLISGYSDDKCGFSVARTYETQRDVLTSITSNWSGDSTPKTSFQYITNTDYQVTSAVQSGEAYSDNGGPNSGATFRLFTYDSKGQVTSCVGYLGSTTTNFGSPLPDRNYSYAYDSVGNRTSSNYTGFPSLQENYTTNVLNQYIAKDNLSVPVSGNVASGQVVLQTYSSATTSSSIAGIQGGFWGGQLIPATDSSGNPANSSAPALLPLIMTALQPSGSSTSVNVQPSTTIFQAIPKKSQGFTYDNDGNMLSDGGSSGTQIWTYTYDAENRMKTATEASLTNSPHCYTLTFTYDYLGRRVDKTVTDSVTSPAFVEDRYIYDGWNLVADYRNTSSSSPSFSLYRTYTWGLDVAGSLSASGGVGALLDITNIVPGVNHEYLPAYDGNGNVAALVDGSSGAVVASYEYSPFGETLRTQPPLVYLSTGGGQYNPTNYDPAIADNPFRFSTKFADVQSGLIYYGNRFYSPTLGRFLNRDPIEEAGGINLYGFVNNDPANGYDVLGYDDWGSYRNGLSQSEHDANAVVQYCADGSAIDAAKAGISSGSIQAFAADSDWGGEGYATGSSGEVTACNTMAMDHPTATDTPAATVTAGTPQPAGSSGGNGGSQSNSSGQGGGVSGSGGSNSGGDNSTAEYLSRPAPDGVTRLPAYVINGNGSNDSVVISPASVNANDNDPVRDAQQYRDAKRYPAPKGVYSLSAHGNRYRIRIRGDLWDAKRLAKALLNNPNNKYTKGTAIILYACNTGSGSDNFASQLAHELNVVVTAPNNVGWWDEKADGTVTFDVGPSRYNDKEGNPIPGPDGKYQINQGPQWKMVSFNP